MAGAFGYWTFAGRNGLAGVEGTYEDTPSGVVYVPNPLNPAVLPSDQILNALSISHAARASFNALYPSLLPEEQERLDTLLEANPKIRKGLEIDDNTFWDRVQRQAIRSVPIYTVGRNGGQR